MTSRIRLAPNPLHDSGDEQPTEPCKRCNGRGLYTQVRRTKHPWIEEEIVDFCPDCGGSGVVPYWQEARR